MTQVSFASAFTAAVGTGASLATPSFTPATGKVTYLIAMLSGTAVQTAAPSWAITSGLAGVTLTKVGERAPGIIGTVVSVYKLTGNGTTGVVTFTPSSGSPAETRLYGWTATNGDGTESGLVTGNDTATSTASWATVPVLSVAPAVDALVVGCFAGRNKTSAMTQGSGFSVIVQDEHASPDVGALIQTKGGTTSTAMDASSLTTNGTSLVGFAVNPASGAVTRTAADSLSFSDAVARAFTLARAAADTLSLSDSVARSFSSRARAAADVLSFSDSVARVPTKFAADTLSLTDSAGRSFTLARPAADTLSLSDSATRAFVSRARAAADTLSLSDAASRAGAASRAAADVLSLSDSGTHGPVLASRAVADVLSLTDAVGRSFVSRARAAADTLTLTDAASRSTTRSRAAADVLTFGDSAGRTWTTARAASDVLTLTDSTSHSPVFANRVAVDVLSLTDSTARSWTASRPAGDTFTLGDVVTRSATRSRAAADILSLTDAAGRTFVPRSRPAADVLHLADALNRSFTTTRLAADVLTLTDAASRHLLFVRDLHLTATLVPDRWSGELTDRWVAGPLPDRWDTTILEDA